MRWCTSIPTAACWSITAAPRWARACTPRSRRWSRSNWVSTSRACAAPPTIPARWPTHRPRRPRPAAISTARRRRTRRAKIRDRLAAFAAEKFGGAAAEVEFADGIVRSAAASKSFTELVQQAYENRVQLWSDGFYKTPGLNWDRDTMQGSPFYYFAYGAAVSEVVIDTLTGEFKLLRADILHDAGNSINPAIDIGQIEGAYIQGMGWLTSEELCWNDQGRLTTHAPSTYKIPTVTDCPRVFNTRLFRQPQRQGHDSALQGGGRTAAAAAVSRCFSRSATRSRASPTTASTRRCARRRRRKRFSTRSKPCAAEGLMSAGRKRRAAAPRADAGDAGQRRFDRRLDAARTRREDDGHRRCVSTAPSAAATSSTRPAASRAINCSSAAMTRRSQRFPLGAGLGQCCGGLVNLMFERLDADSDWSRAEIDEEPIAALPVRRRPRRPGAGAGTADAAGATFSWIDTRDDMLPKGRRGRPICTDTPEAEIDAAPAGQLFSRDDARSRARPAPLRANPRRDDFAYFGLIGSASKRRNFETRMRAAVSTRNGSRA